MRNVRKHLMIALGILLAGAFLLPLVASATAWNPPYTLGAGGTKPSVAIDSQGGIHYVWWEPTAKIIQYAYCAGLTKKSCTAPETLPNNGNDSFYPSIAVDPADAPNVVWESRDAGSYSIYWSRRVNGAWAPIVQVSSEAYSELPDIAIGPNGVIHVVYQSKQDNTGYVYYVKSNDGFGTLQAVRLDAVESDRPISVAAESASNGLVPEGAQLTNGLYPRVAADDKDLAHVVWNAPSPYGIYYNIQKSNGSFGTKITVSTGHKDQTPDITVSPNGAVGILWGTYDNFNAAFAEYNGGKADLKQYDVDGGVAQSLWPRVAADCSGAFHFVFQGKVNTDGDWNIYHRTYNATDNKFGKRETIADANAQEQTPVLAVTHRAAIIYTNTTNALANASTADLDISCDGSVTPTSEPSATPTGSAVPSATLTQTPTGTTTVAPSATPTNTPTTVPPSPSPSPTSTIQTGTEHIPATDPRIAYTGNWKEYRDRDATDKSYVRCGGRKKCRKNWSALLNFVGGKRVEWEYGYANTYGKAEVYLDGKLFERVDLCKLRKHKSKAKFGKRTYVLSGTATTAHSIKIRAIGHSDCSPRRHNYVAVDGFNILR